MPSNKTKVRRALQQACSRHLWCAIPRRLEDYIVAYASAVLEDEDIYYSSHGPLFEIAVDCSHWYHQGLLDLDIKDPYSQNLHEVCDPAMINVATVYDMQVTIRQASDSSFDRTSQMDDVEFDRWCKEGYFTL
jgi:hypothetical protein